MEKIYSEKTYVICHNGSDIIHPVVAEPGTNVASGQPEFEEFADEAAWKARLTELGFDVTKLDPPSIDSLGAMAGPEGKLKRLTAEERKAMSPEERKAFREERRTARQAMKAARLGAAAETTEAAPVAEATVAKATKKASK